MLLSSISRIISIAEESSINGIQNHRIPEHFGLEGSLNIIINQPFCHGQGHFPMPCCFKTLPVWLWALPGMGHLQILAHAWNACVENILFHRAQNSSWPKNLLSSHKHTREGLTGISSLAVTALLDVQHLWGPTRILHPFPSPSASHSPAPDTNTPFPASFIKSHFLNVPFKEPLSTALQQPSHSWWLFLKADYNTKDEWNTRNLGHKAVRSRVAPSEKFLIISFAF